MSTPQDKEVLDSPTVPERHEDSENPMYEMAGPESEDTEDKESEESSSEESGTEQNAEVDPFQEVKEQTAEQQNSLKEKMDSFNGTPPDVLLRVYEKARKLNAEIQSLKGTADPQQVKELQSSYETAVLQFRFRLKKAEKEKPTARTTFTDAPLTPERVPLPPAAERKKDDIKRWTDNVCVVAQWYTDQAKRLVEPLQSLSAAPQSLKEVEDLVTTLSEKNATIQGRGQSLDRKLGTFRSADFKNKLLVILEKVNNIRKGLGMDQVKIEWATRPERLFSLDVPRTPSAPASVALADLPLQLPWL